jgi:hypothetical protein
MKKQITFLLLISILTVNAQTNFNFYYGFNQSLGVEILASERYGIGFAASLENNKALGVFAGDNINEYDNKNFLSTTTQKWLAVYGVQQIGWIKNIQISVDYGVAMYGRHSNFLDSNRNEFYHKKDKIIFRPMAGINANHAINSNIGVLVGYDTFSFLKFGMTVYF